MRFKPELTLRRCLCIVVATSGAALTTAPSFADPDITGIYRWNDPSGRTGYTNVLPRQFRKYATRIEIDPVRPTPEQRRQAEARAASERTRDADYQHRRTLLRAADPPVACPVYLPLPASFADSPLAQTAVRFDSKPPCTGVDTPSAPCR